MLFSVLKFVIAFWKDRYLPFALKCSMVDFTITGPIVGILAISDVLLHIYLDTKKSTLREKSRLREPSVHVQYSAMIAVSISTLLSFALVLLIPIAWILELEITELWFLIPIVEPSIPVWLSGLVLVILGIILHSWSRYVRQEMAASWAMSEEHRLITTGPYSKVRHPSYTSYFLSFIGLFLLLPSVVALIMMIGFWGYYIAAVTEEQHLLNHFGGAYSEYMKRTGRFLPGL